MQIEANWIDDGAEEELRRRDTDDLERRSIVEAPEWR
jgi:hypothetical protein